MELRVSDRSNHYNLLFAHISTGPREHLFEMLFRSSLLLLCLPLRQAAAFDYSFVDIPEEPGLVLTDVTTGVSDILTIFKNELVAVKVTGIEWEPLSDGESAPDVIVWETTVDGKVQASGTFNLTDTGRELPSELKVGEIKVSSGGRHEIVVVLTHGERRFDASGDYQSYAAGVAIIPLLVVLIMAASTRMVC